MTYKMRVKIINFLKHHPNILQTFWNTAKYVLFFLSKICRIKEKNILFASYGGRKFDDSPKAIYDEICKRQCFNNYKLIWAFDEPEKFNISRGRKIKIDTLSFFKALLTSKVWVSNSGMDRGIEYKDNRIIKIETWHGTPLKKIEGEENQNSLYGKTNKKNCKVDDKTIRCAQSEYDREIFERIFHASKDSILLCDLPRNDALLKYTKEECNQIKNKLEIPLDKKIILYVPTYREYYIDEHNNTFFKPPIDLNKWKSKLADKYVLLVRAHYAVVKALNISENDFVKDLSSYPVLNDLYAISDLMISDYSSTYFDFSIIEKPMLCFAYDLEEYEEKRGLYLKLNDTLPCSIDRNEDEVISHILNLDYKTACNKTKLFKNKFAPFAGNASKVVVDELTKRLNINKSKEQL